MRRLITFQALIQRGLMPLKKPPGCVVLFAWRMPWFVIFVGCQWPGCESGSCSLWTQWNIHRSPNPPASPGLPSHTHTHIRATAQPFRWYSTRTSTWNLLQSARRSTHSFAPSPTRLWLTSWYCAHNRARSVGVKPCCSAPVPGTRAMQLLKPCNYSSQARLSTLESRG